MRTDRSGLATVALLALAGVAAPVAGCGYSLKNVSADQAPAPPRAKSPLPVGALCNDEDLARRLESAGLFERVKTLSPGATAPPDEAGVLLELQRTSEVCPLANPTSSNYAKLTDIGFFFLFFPPLFLVPLGIAPNARQAYALRCMELGGAEVARYEAVAEFEVGVQVFGAGKWWRANDEGPRAVETAGREHALSVLVARLISDEALADRLGTRPAVPVALAGWLIAHTDRGFFARTVQYRVGWDATVARFRARPMLVDAPLGPAGPVVLEKIADAPPELRGARAAGPLYAKLQGSLDGRACWWVVAPAWHEGAAEPAASALVAELYEGDPDTGAAPLEVVVVARRAPDGSWTPERSYLRNVEGLVSVTVALEGGRPVRVEAQPLAEPPLEDFLVAKESLTAEARWRNRALLVAKTQTVPKLLDERKTSELEALALRIEQLVLDLNRESELLKDQAQKVLAHNGGQAPPGAGADAFRDLSLAYQERIEILKPILAAVKEEIANRGR